MAKTQTFSAKKASFARSPNGSRMSETRYKRLTKEEVPKYNQTPKTKARGRWNKTETAVASAKSGIQTVTTGRTIQKLMGTESINRVAKGKQQLNKQTTKTANTKTATVGGVTTTTYTTTTKTQSTKLIQQTSEEERKGDARGSFQTRKVKYTTLQEDE